MACAQSMMNYTNNGESRTGLAVEIVTVRWGPAAEMLRVNARNARHLLLYHAGLQENMSSLPVILKGQNEYSQNKGDATLVISSSILY